MSRRRRRRLAASASALVLLLAGVGFLVLRGSGSSSPRATRPAPSASPDPGGGVLRLLSENRFASLDPTSLLSPRERDLGRLLYRTLLTYDGDGRTLVPDLATDRGTASAGGRVWTYALRPGAVYADGTPVLAADVVRGILLARQRAALPAGLLRAASAPDALHVVLTFGAPFADADSLVALTATAPVPVRGARASGPYQLAALSGSSFRLVRNPRWTGTPPGPDEVVAELGLDGPTIDQRLAAGAGGDAFAVTDKPALDIAPAGRDHVVSGPDGSVLFAAMDTRRGPFSDLKVRQALEVAFPLKAVRDAAGGDAVGTPATDLLPPAFPGHQDLDLYGGKARKHAGDPSRAQRLLSDAGLPQGVAITVALPRSASAVGAALREGLAPAGFRATVTEVPDARYYDAVGRPATQPDLVLFAWQPDWLTASAVVPPLFTCAALTATANRNVAQHCDPGFDQQVQIALAATDDDTRAAIWRALDRRLVEEARVVPRSFGVASALVGPDVRGARSALCFGGMVDLLRLTRR